MTTFVLIPGAGGSPWMWSRVAARLRTAGREAIAIDLPGDDDTAGLPRYTEITVSAIADLDDVVLVAQSLGGFTAPLVCDRVPVRALVLVNAMIPEPHETPGVWWDATGAVEARIAAAAAAGYGTNFDPFVYFLHDVPTEVAADGEAHVRQESDAVFATPCEFARWPDVVTRVLAGAEDRFFPVEFQRRVARERLGIDADVLPGGHLMPLSYPDAVTDYLLTACR